MEVEWNYFSRGGFPVPFLAWRCSCDRVREKVGWVQWDFGSLSSGTDRCEGGPQFPFPVSGMTFRSVPFGTWGCSVRAISQTFWYCNHQDESRWLFSFSQLCNSWFQSSRTPLLLIYSKLVKPRSKSLWTCLASGVTCAP